MGFPLCPSAPLPLCPSAPLPLCPSASSLMRAPDCVITDRVGAREFVQSAHGSLLLAL